ncbi:bacteriophage holin [Patescibacteria group bacterium]|nr:bacteriophage holin [Patescibacteria group bacterium]MBU1683134.1 bacteriophage holin [Patescibacteria group bacterium]MBU1934659.1 bacteriophage holin [Patescibacteria group bacterium]
MNKLNATALGLSFGIIWGLAIALVVIASMYANWGGAFLDVMGSLYIGVESTWLGALYGAVWGFVDGFIGLFLMAWIYNKIS